MINKTMKKIILLLCFIAGIGSAHADEGMWLLKLMERQQLAKTLKKAGLKLKPEALYSEEAPSLRECIGIFGNGCTGEIISPDGLVLTNNHCGFSYVHAMSTMEHNYLQDGYFAQNREEELQVPDLDFTFVLRIVDVTKEVEAKAKEKGVNEYTAQSQAFLQPLAEELLQASDLKDKKNVKPRIVPYFGGNEFYIFYEQVFPDVRLVVNPPQNIAQFGFNQDNWLWPRHNADFAMFRIYADANGEPAAYAETNVPLKCKKYLPISVKGVEEGDYTMIMGFPGRTSRYLTASEVHLRTQSQNTPINMAGEAQLNFMKALMDRDSVANLKLADEYMSLGNVVKNYGGMNESVKKTGLMSIKADEEKAFRAFAQNSNNPAFNNIIERIDSLVCAVEDTLHDYYLLNSTAGQSKFEVNVPLFDALFKAVEAGKNDEVATCKENILKWYDATIAGLDLNFDRQTVELLAPYWVKYNRKCAAPEYLKDEATAKRHYAEVYETSMFRNREQLNAFLNNPNHEVFAADALVKHWTDFNAASKKYGPALNAYNTKRKELDKIYNLGLCEMYEWRKAPDANFTLRMTYGKVCGYSPRDAVQYDWNTVLEGMFEKENPNDPDYVINEKLRSFYETKNFGKYARKDGKLPTCFLSNNDITGGNSGSPVMNAKGELVGVAFDGNIESLSSDLRFNPELQRCINVDIRYVLFLIDTFGGSSYLLDELEIRD
jgi:hypothetical protein